MRTRRPSTALHPLHRQRGAALMIMLVIMIIGAVTIFVNALNSSALQLDRDKVTADALAKAKEALIGYAVSQSITSAGNLQLPDLGYSDPGLTVPSEGSSPPNFTGNTQGYSLIGKLPWKTLGIPPLRDGYGECLWYALSGWFKNTNSSSAINWDTPGQIDVLDNNGNIIASNLAVLLVAPGTSLDGQSRVLSDPVYTQCGGNYDARNYLDSYNNSDAIAGVVNYFSGSTNSRIANNTSNKQFVMTNNYHYNDRFLFITTDDIFRPIIQRIDFSTQISGLMNDPYFQSVPISGTKGTGSVSCNSLAPANQAFCANWLEMLLLTRLPVPSSVTIDGAATALCNRVLIFGGQKTAAQVRLFATDKSNPANYLEAPNLTSFAVPTATASNFSGASIFKANNPSADLLKCFP